MSYRDIRNFNEMLRMLGYPNLVSMESFRIPNFGLVAELLIWLSKRFDPDADIPIDIESEEGRVALIRNIAQFMAIKANIKLNTKRLYQADGYAVKEMLKITTLLQEALAANTPKDEESNDDDQDGINMRYFDLSDKVSDVKQSKQLASEITATGAKLYDLLGKEVDLRASRHLSAGRQFEATEVEAGIKKATDALKQEIADTKQLIDNVSATETNLDAKIERRKIEIDRYEKRLQTLKKVRPAFLEEFVELEAELEQLFVQYAVRMRCLNELEQLAAESERTQIERQLLAASQRVVETVPLEQADPDEDLLAFEEPVPEPRPGGHSRQERPQARTGRNRPVRPSTLYAGTEPSLTGSGSSLDLSSDSDTDELLDDDEEPELVHSEDDDSFGLELSAMEKRAPSGRKTTNKLESNSDDDF